MVCLPPSPRSRIRGEDMKYQRSAGCSGVDFLCEGTKRYAAFLEVLNHRYQVAHAAGQPVELPDYERVAVLQSFQATEQGRALCRRAG